MCEVRGKVSILLAAAHITLPAGAQTSGAGTAAEPPCPLFGSTPETHGKLVTPPTILHKPQPKYPSEARKSHIEGIVVLCVTIGKDGAVRNVRAISGPEELSPAAIKAVQQWRFRPYLANGEPVEASLEVRVNFRLSGIQVTST
jgi:protein TonB